MPNPDIKQGTSYSFSFVIGILMFIITFFIISKMNTDEFYIKIILFFILSVIAYAISLLCNFALQLYMGKDIDSTIALKGAIPSGVSVFIGSILASISMCRIPVASLFAPLFMEESSEQPVANSPEPDSPGSVKVCHITNLTLEYVESQYKSIIGISWGFYTSISMVVGMMIGGGIITNG